MLVRVTVRSGRPGVRNPRYEYEETYFEQAGITTAVFVGDELAAIGPFCKNCGHPEMAHGKDDRRRPDTCPPPPPINRRYFGDPRPEATLLPAKTWRDAQ